MKTCCALQQAEQRVEREVARRLEVIGADESLWPAAAREALARQVNKLENMHTVLASLQNELDTEQHTVAALQATNQTLQASQSPAELLCPFLQATLELACLSFHWRGQVNAQLVHFIACGKREVGFTTEWALGKQNRYSVRLCALFAGLLLHWLQFSGPLNFLTSKTCMQEQLRSAEGRLHKQELDFRESRRQLETKVRASAWIPLPLLSVFVTAAAAASLDDK